MTVVVCGAAVAGCGAAVCAAERLRWAGQVLRAAAMLASRVEAAWRRVVLQMAEPGAPWAPPQAQHRSVQVTRRHLPTRPAN